MSKTARSSKSASIALNWPVCTVPGCRHTHEWPSDALRRGAFDMHHDWIRNNGSATCSCHDNPTFPCDADAEESVPAVSTR